MLIHVKPEARKRALFLRFASKRVFARDLAALVIAMTLPLITVQADDGDDDDTEPRSEAVDQAVRPTPEPTPEPSKAEHIDLSEVVTIPLGEEPQGQEGQQQEGQQYSGTESSVGTPSTATDEKAAVSEKPLDSPVSAETPGDAVEGESGESQSPLAALIGQQEKVEETPSRLPLVLLGAEVSPGTATRLSWTPKMSFMGIAAPTAVLVVNGVKEGPTLCLTGAVHGDELNGIEIIRHIVYNIDPQELSGAVIGVPIVNLQGFRRASRYLPDRRDLNRYFPGNPDGSSASRIAHSFFEEVVAHCDLLVDIHTGSFHRTNLPQVRADLAYPDVKELAKGMGAIVVVQSKGHPGSLRRAAVEAGVTAITLEAGQPHELQKSAVNHGIKSLENLMDSLGMLKRRSFWEIKAEPIYYSSRWVRATQGGILFSDVELGDRVKEGDVLGTITDPITNLRASITAPADGRIIGMALNQVMYPGFAAYHIGLQATAEDAAEKAGELESEDGEPLDSVTDDDPEGLEVVPASAADVSRSEPTEETPPPSAPKPEPLDRFDVLEDSE